MQVNLETFLLLNACMNAVLLCVTLRWNGKSVKIWRVLLAALLGALYAAVAFLPGMLLLRTIPCSVLMCIAMLLVVARWHKAMHLLRALALMFTATFLMGGTVYAISQALGGALYWRLGAAVAAGLAVVLGRSTHRARIPKTTVRIRLGEASVEIDGLVDTGNLLRDPINGLPVLIAPHAVLHTLLPKTCDPSRLETLPAGFRLVQAVSTGGARTLMCFRPGQVSLREGVQWREVNAMVAIAPHTMPEGAVALVPVSLLSA